MSLEKHVFGGEVPALSLSGFPYLASSSSPIMSDQDSAVFTGFFSCGVDEAGRGALAGPVHAAAVVLDPRKVIQGLRDSKTLSSVQRDVLSQRIKASAIAWAVASACVDEIEVHNILRAALLAMKRAIEGLSVCPAMVQVDGLHAPDVEIPVQTVVKGDQRVPAISAASILAKTARDEEMLLLHAKFPHFGFDRHKGYPTGLHKTRLAIYGPCAAHRRSFAPVKTCMTTFI